MAIGGNACNVRAPVWPFPLLGVYFYKEAQRFTSSRSWSKKMNV